VPGGSVVGFANGQAQYWRHLPGQQRALSHNIAQLPADLDMSFFPNSGAEAVEGAVKTAYK
jgi:acetylornithine/succinyldiaminopimelate/putrescine aminotransferase